MDDQLGLIFEDSNEKIFQERFIDHGLLALGRRADQIQERFLFYSSSLRRIGVVGNSVSSSLSLQINSDS